MTLTVALLGTNTNYHDADASTNWAVTTIGGPTDETDVFFQGTQAVSAQASNKAGQLYYDYGSGTELNFSSGGNQEDYLIGMWINVTTLGALDTLANTGLGIRVFTDTSNYATFTIAGDGELRNFAEGKGGYKFIVIDPTLRPSTTNGTFNLASIRYIGLYIDTTAQAKTDNIMCDGIVVAKGIELTGTDTDGWLDAVDYCTAYSSRAWGFLEYDDTEQIIYSKGKIHIGSSAQTAVTSLTDNARTIIFATSEYWIDEGTGNWFPAVKDDYLGIYGFDASGYATTFTDSQSTFIGDSVIRCALDFSGMSNEATSLVTLSGTKFSYFLGDITFKNDSDWNMNGVIWDNCSIVDVVGTMEIENCTFQYTKDCYKRTVEECWTYISAAYTDETTDINDVGVGDVALGTGSGDIIYFGSEDQFGSMIIEQSGGVAFTAGTHAIEYYNGSWTALSGVVASDRDAAGNYHFSTTHLHRISWTWPTDWTTTSVNSGASLYYVRIRNTAAMTGSATLDQAWLNTIGSGSALLWNSSITTTTVHENNFENNTHDENTAHAIQVDSSGSINYQNLVHSNNGADVHFTAASGDLTVNKNGTSNPSTSDIEGSGSVTFVGTVPISIEYVDEDGNTIQYVQSTCQLDPRTVYTSAAGNAAGDGDFVISEAIPADTPAVGSIIVQPLGGTKPHRYLYASWATSTFTLPTPDTGTCASGGSDTVLKRSTGTSFLTLWTAGDIDEGIVIRNTTDGSYAIVDEIVDADTINTTPLTGGTLNTWGVGDTWSFHTLAIAYTATNDIVLVPQDVSQSTSGGLVTWSHIYDTPQNIRIDWRKQEHGTRYRPSSSVQQIGANGLTVSFTLTEDTVSS